MKIILKMIMKILICILGVLILFLISMAFYHRIMLKKESRSIVPIGRIVAVNGHNIHVYAEGEKNDKPTLVVMSGSGVAAPVYDYKVLYSKLSNEYHTAVIEKPGYGYSDVSGIPGDIDTMLEETREALRLAGEEGPYVLLPHSMSGLEAIYWAQHYPGEVAAIIGLDMAVPEHYENMPNRILQISFMKAMTSMGLHRIPLINPVSERGLSETEIQQHKYLVYRNTLNDDVFAECKAVFDNGIKVGQGVLPDIPVLMFSSNGEGTGLGDDWVLYEKNFADKSQKIKLVQLDCGHNIHYYISDFISQNIKGFLEETFDE